MLSLNGAAATSIFPSADEATELQYSDGRLFETHVAPELVEVKTAPEPGLLAVIATNSHPSADEATEDHESFVSAVADHVAPELVETKSPPGHCPATRVEPSAELAIHRHQLVGAEVSIHPCANAALGAANSKKAGANRLNKFF